VLKGEGIMSVLVERAEVWATSVADEPGATAKKLKTLAEAGADLDFVIARRAPEKPGTGVLFVTPLRGDREIEAATEVGFAVSESLHSVRMEGENRPGIGAELMQKLADAGINLRGISAAVIGTRFIAYLALDTAADAQKAMDTLSSSG
jgi:hypothetical protein